MLMVVLLVMRMPQQALETRLAAEVARLMWRRDVVLCSLHTGNAPALAAAGDATNADGWVLQAPMRMLIWWLRWCACYCWRPQFRK